jgi:hypothetical protein
MGVPVLESLLEPFSVWEKSMRSIWSPDEDRVWRPEAHVAEKEVWTSVELATVAG